MTLDEAQAIVKEAEQIKKEVRAIAEVEDFTAKKMWEAMGQNAEWKYAGGGIQGEIKAAIREGLEGLKARKIARLSKLESGK